VCKKLEESEVPVRVQNKNRGAHYAAVSGFYGVLENE